MSDPDPILFFTRPISLFFVILAVISLIFPFWQKHRHTRWARFYLPVSLIAISVPFWISPGEAKLAALVFLLGGVYSLYRRIQQDTPRAVSG